MYLFYFLQPFFVDLQHVLVIIWALNSVIISQVLASASEMSLALTAIDAR